MKKFTTALFSSAAVLFAVSSANAAILDDFGGGAGVETFTQSLPADFAMVGGTNAVVGGVVSTVERLVSAASDADPAAVNAMTIEINRPGLEGVYSHSQNNGVAGESSVSYDLTGTDLTEMLTVNAFQLELDQLDLNGGFVGVEVNGVQGGVLLDAATAVDVIAAGNMIDIPFSLFAGVDFSAGALVSIIIDGLAPITGGGASVDSLDISIDSFGTICTGRNDAGAAVAGNCGPVEVSEPASLGLLGLGLLGIGAAARRRKA